MHREMAESEARAAERCSKKEVGRVADLSWEKV